LALLLVESGGNGRRHCRRRLSGRWRSIAPDGDALWQAQIVLGIQGPDPALLAGVAPGAWVVAGLDPFGQRPRVEAYAAAGLEALAMEFMPRITRAQSMDILSSQANLAGYKAVLVAANPMAGPSR
jgi:NAD(P) transhydrogenase subunit alpha